MNNVFRILIGLLFATFIPILICAQDAKFPIVKNYGGIYEVPNAVMPDQEIKYKLVIDLKSAQPDKNKINRGLNNVARMMNLHGLGGISKENLNVVVVAHGGATEAILDNGAYVKKNGVDNPNLPLIDALKKAGAEIYVCGQSLLGRGYEQEEVYPEVNIGLSMLTVVSTYMHRGHQKFVF
ncbi:MAG: DsrE family protein [Balneolaceae bacterium]|nr:DsrE family protein [Balneolaceae bacterium]